MKLVPKELMLAAIPVKVQIDPTYIEKNGCIGQSIYHEQLIVIDNSRTPVETVEQSFFHELVHWILHVQNRDALRKDEEFVDGFSHLLYQALKTGGFQVVSEQDKPAEVGHPQASESFPRPACCNTCGGEQVEPRPC